MSRLSTLLVLIAFVSACDQQASDTTVAGDDDKTSPVIEEIRTYSGADAYEQVCAECHEEGLNGAPRTGDPEAWAGRSPLWEAVLFEHAKKGYNDMPAKGGVETLDDTIVEKAAEYMLRMTHGTPPPD